ncbi:helix-turn-helix transcriptional regulator [Rhodoferax ferrireducens]|uniref:helix-turn-helix transcriptional regulator n=1 Tax=Rhodoferax ferrireducens TaxID=192843 RepID=UPI0009FC8E66|nr:helix-turn-helix domain-containing protein [Rhodoferax ferrireducens]
MEALLDAHQLTLMLGVSRRTLENIIEKQEGPSFIMIGRQRRWRQSDVDRWFESRLTQTTRPNIGVSTVRKEATST